MVGLVITIALYIRHSVQCAVLDSWHTRRILFNIYIASYVNGSVILQEMINEDAC
jgi:hypothetical protein